MLDHQVVAVAAVAADGGTFDAGVVQGRSDDVGCRLG